MPALDIGCCINEACFWPARQYGPIHASSMTVIPAVGYGFETR